MSYWVYLENKKGESVRVSRFTDGGTCAIGGSCEAELNITYNYCQYYYPFLKGYLGKKEGLKWLHGKKAKRTIRKLKKAVSVLGIKQDNDYWKSTTGNAGYALSVLLKWAKQHPKAKWRIS